MEFSAGSIYCICIPAPFYNIAITLPMRHPAVIILLSALLTGNAVFSRSLELTNDTSSACFQKASRLLDEALNFMQKHYYRKNYVRWDTLIAAAKAQLAASGNCEETYDIITWCFKQINETHSFLMPPAKAAIYNYDTAALQQKPAMTQLMGDISGELVDDDIAYLTVPWVSTTDSLICTRIADSLQQLIASLDEKGTRNWIIDLRKNTGGNCWPMLAGIGPLLGNGVCGFFVSPREKIPISYQDGAAFQGKNLRCKASNSGYKTKTEKKSIVILTGRRTVSSGEIIALAFKGKEQVYFYGEPTAGYTTANATYTLSDNSMLILTVCMEADRTGKVYEGKIMPDEVVAGDEHTVGTGDAAKLAAINWLLSQRF
jgi:carboxyl-terminal processing protease